MLDPTQLSALDQARSRPIRVSGFPGSGVSRLARAIAEDAERRGQTCLLIGSSPALDTPVGHVGEPVPLNPILARRATGPVAPARSVALRPVEDVLALRASQDPDSARVALRLHRRASELVREHGLVADEVEIAGRVGAGTDPRLLAALRLTAVDAMTFAAAVWSDPGAPSLSEVASALRGEAPGRTPETAYAGLVLEGTPEAVEDFLGRLAREGGGTALASGLADLRRALDPWAWRSTLRDVGEAHAWAVGQAGLIHGVEMLIEAHGGVAAALGAQDASADGIRTLGVLADRFPDRPEAEVVATCRALADDYRDKARRLEPFLARHASRPLAEVRAVQQQEVPPTGGPSIGEVAHRLRSAAHAMGRLRPALSYLEASLPERAWGEILRRPLADLASATDIAFQDSERSTAARTLLEIREAFSAAGFGDVLDAGDLHSRLAATSGAAAPQARGSSPPDFLDLLLPEGRAPSPSPAVPGGRIDRARGPGDLDGLADAYDVVVLDDEGQAPDSLVERMETLSYRIHSLGVSRGEHRSMELTHPHRQRDVVLANVASGRERTPFWLGAPRGAGVVVRVVGVDVAPDLAGAAAGLVATLSGAGYDAAVLGEGRGEADVVVAFAERADADVVRAACGVGRDGVVVLCRESAWHGMDLMIDADDAGLSAHGWRMVANVAEGRIFVRDGKSAVLVREPAWNDLAVENVVERVERVRSMGWDPVVDWLGSPREPSELARLLAASAVAPDPRMRLVMQGGSLG